MDELAEFETYVAKAIEARPDLKQEFRDLRDLCISEIEAGESTTHEIHLAKEDMRQLTEPDD